MGRLGRMLIEEHENLPFRYFSTDYWPHTWVSIYSNEIREDIKSMNCDDIWKHLGILIINCTYYLYLLLLYLLSVEMFSNLECRLKITYTMENFLYIQQQK